MPCQTSRRPNCSNTGILAAFLENLITLAIKASLQLFHFVTWIAKADYRVLQREKPTTLEQ